VKVFAAALRASWQAFAMLADRQRNCYRTSAIVAVVLVYRHYMSPYGFDTGRRRERSSMKSVRSHVSSC